MGQYRTWGQGVVLTDLNLPAVEDLVCAALPAAGPVAVVLALHQCRKNQCRKNLCRKNHCHYLEVPSPHSPALRPGQLVGQVGHCRL